MITANCRKACKKCDEGRACQRCVKLGIADTCIDSPRTDRSKGAKRGPYKKRQQQQKGKRWLPFTRFYHAQEKRGDSPNPNLVSLNTVTGGINQTHPDSNTASLPYEQTVAWDSTPVFGYQQVSPYQPQQQDPARPRQSSLSSLDMMPLSYYSPPINPPIASYQGTSSPLTVDQYASPSLSTSPASSSTLILPQDTLHSVFMMDGQEPIYPANQMMMVPLQDPYDFPPPPPQPAQPIYYHQPYYLPQQKPQLYWDSAYNPCPYF